jgi:hypothetical protein
MTTKKISIIYWVTTSFIFLFEGVMPALTGHTELAKEGIRHLGYPDYFGTMLVIAKVLGSIAILLPKTPNRIREWAYAGLGFELLAAFISHLAVDGFDPMALMPLVIFAILAGSYVCYQHLLQKAGTGEYLRSS